MIGKLIKTNLSFLGFEQALRTIGTGSLLIFIVAHLSRSEFGMFLYVLLFFGILKSIIMFGTEDIVINLLDKDNNRMKTLTSIFFLRMIMNTIIILVILLFGNYWKLTEVTSTQSPINGVLAMLVLNLFSHFEVLSHLYETDLNAKKIAKIKSAQFFISSLVKIAVVLYNGTVYWIIVSYGFEYLVLGVLYVFTAPQGACKELLLGFDKIRLRNMLNASKPYALIGIMGVLALRQDQIFVSQILTLEKFAILGLAIRFIDIYSLLPIVYSKTVYPILVKMKGLKDSELDTKTRDLFSPIIWATISVNILLTMLGICVLIWDRFHFVGVHKESIIIFMIMQWIVVFQASTQLSYRWLMIKGYTGINIARQSICLLISILSNFVLISRYGILGAAISAVFNSAISGFLIDYLWVQTRPLVVIKIQAINPFRIRETFKMLFGASNLNGYVS